MAVIVDDYRAVLPNVGQDTPHTLPMLFSAAVANAPDVVAVVDGEQRYAWQDWEDRAHTVACALSDLGEVRFTGGSEEKPRSLAPLAARWAGNRPQPVHAEPDTTLVLMASPGTTSMRPKICVHFRGDPCASWPRSRRH